MSWKSSFGQVFKFGGKWSTTIRSSQYFSWRIAQSKRALYVGQYEIGSHYKGVHLFILMGWDRGIINTLMFNVENLHRGPKYEVWLIASVVKGVTFLSYFL